MGNIKRIKELMGLDKFKRINEMSFVFLNSLDSSDFLFENDNREKLIKRILNGDFEVDNHRNFLNSMNQSQRKEMLSDYTVDDFKEMTTYKVNGYNVGFAIKDDGDIVSVHNNSGIGNISEPLLRMAIKYGGTKLDHFDGRLSNIYEPLGFKEYDRYKWDDQYAPKNWDYEKYGKPDVVMRRLQNQTN